MGSQGTLAVISLGALAALAACPGRPHAVIPVAPVIIVTPTVAPVPWWTAGDAACPSLDTLGVAPGGPPGSSIQPGHLRGGPEIGEVHCEAAGVAHGPSTRFHPDGRPAEVGMNDRGQQTGAWTTWHPNGVMASHGGYANSVPAATWSTWYPSGNPRDRGELHPTGKRGMWLLWDDKGRPDAEPQRFVEYSDSGNVRMSGVILDGKARQSLPVCIVGMSFPGCRTIPIVDFAVRRWTSSDEPVDGSSPYSVTFQLGGIYNIDQHHSAGASFGWLFDATYPSYLIDARYRYWLAEPLAFEGSLGLLVPRDDRDGIGVAASAALDLADIITVIATMELHPAADGGTDLQTVVGFRFGLPTLLAVIAALGEGW